MAEQHDRLSGPRRDGVDDGGDVGELPLRGVAGTVGAGSEATAVHGEGGRIAS
jgi:hypothetical protein